MELKIRHYIKVRHDIKKFVMTSTIRHNAKKLVMTSQIRHDANNTDCKIIINNDMLQQKGKIKSK